MRNYNLVTMRWLEKVGTIELVCDRWRCHGKVTRQTVIKEFRALAVKLGLEDKLSVPEAKMERDRLESRPPDFMLAWPHQADSQEAGFAP